MPNTFRRWFKSVRLLILFYAIFPVLALTTTSRGDIALTGWRIALAVSAIMVLWGLIGSWWTITRGVGKKCFPSLEYVGIWSLISVEASHAFYIGPIIWAQGGDAAFGRTFSHSALALAVYLVSRRRMRWQGDTR